MQGFISLAVWAESHNGETLSAKHLGISDLRLLGEGGRSEFSVVAWVYGDVTDAGDHALEIALIDSDGAPAFSADCRFAFTGITGQRLIVVERIWLAQTPGRRRLVLRVDGAEIASYEIKLYRPGESA